jgi:Domain of unknown function (DUF1707)
MAAASSLRIGNAEREATAANLREHYAHGRLTLEEFQERLNSVFDARTQGDIEGLTADLPHTSGLTPVWSSAAGLPLPASAGGNSWQDESSWQRGSHGGRSQGAQASGTASRASAVLTMLMLLTGLAIVVSLIFPFALFGLWLPKPLLAVFGVVMVVRRLVRWLVRSGTRRR